eukprot:CAMPEP_0116996962 /NCGR_PEP_ID=MMETSP0472-20121206/579_1 /TAXON_ID=693140 ORGANISM="Tiarina fusus, Strain LIS" /NCGR_SAMPLE_ID=MMETSP0472 /ASSEMBLY_ACC=CAM_ASM_000603 /LENGTH=346 /DNA_ID=CAMNT_0004695729 /DNA_START=127 /DNA_END=1167 /DNA_ORIENTATION=+
MTTRSRPASTCPPAPLGTSRQRTSQEHPETEGVAISPRRRTRSTDPSIEDRKMEPQAKQNERPVDSEAGNGGAARGGPTTRSRKRRGVPSQVPPAPQTAASAPKKRARQGTTLKKAPPGSIGEEEDKKPSANENCCICMCEVEPDDLAGVSGCDHRFCFGCIEKWAERENTCPLCKVRFSKIDRINKKRKKGTKNTKKVKQRDQRSDLVPGAALEGLLANFASRHPNPPNIARLIFSATAGNFEFNTIQGPPPRTRSGPRNPFRDEPNWSSDEEDSPLSNFLRAFHGPNNMMHVVRPISVTHAHFSSRSYASNINDTNAGNGVENPLNIDDSDDDTVEVVQVRRPA